MALTFVSSHTLYSLYRRPSGQSVCVLHRTFPVNDATITDVQETWSFFGYPRQQKPFVSRMQSITDAAYNLTFCESCADITDDVTRVNGSDYCQSCVDEYTFFCEGCNSLGLLENSNTVYDDYPRCESCISSYYTWCEHCDEYVDSGDAEHDHNNGCDCTAHVPSFTMAGVPSDGEHRADIPAGNIDAEGLYRIENLVAHLYLRAVVQSLEPVATTNRGSFVRRLSSAAHKQGVTLPAEILSEVGNIVAQHSKGSSLTITYTRHDLNEGPEMFAHEDSCWWGSYSASRCALKTNGGMGMRSWGNGTLAYPTGRAWVLPLTTAFGGLRPTHDASNADAFLVFNGYGDLDGYTPARIVSNAHGMSYRKVSLSIDPMFVNGDVGYLVGPQDLLNETPSVSLTLSQHAPASVARDYALAV